MHRSGQGSAYQDPQQSWQEAVLDDGHGGNQCPSSSNGGEMIAQGPHRATALSHPVVVRRIAHPGSPKDHWPVEAIGNGKRGQSSDDQPQGILGPLRSHIPQGEGPYGQDDKPHRAVVITLVQDLISDSL